jgi:hypothetical protein
MATALHAQLRWEQAAIGQLPELPSSSRVYRLALRLEVLRRLTAAVLSLINQRRYPPRLRPCLIIE